MARDLSHKKQSAAGVNTSGRSVIMDSFMSDVKKKLRQNEYKEVKSSGTSSVWTSYMQIVDKDNKKVSAVKCITCDALLKFDSAKTGTSHLLKHTRSCGKMSQCKLRWRHLLDWESFQKKARLLKLE